MIGSIAIIEAVNYISSENADTSSKELLYIPTVYPESTSNDNLTDKKEDYNPDPYKRPGRKKQGRENANKARKRNWEPRNNKRDNKPAKPKKHTPGKEHRKYFEISNDNLGKIVIFG